jgi:hypothetical protein
MSEQMFGMLFALEWSCAFFGPGDEGFVHWDDCCLASGLNLWIHVWSLVIIFRRDSGCVLSLCLKSCPMLRQLRRCFSLSHWGLSCWQYVTFDIVCITVCWTGPSEVSNMFPTFFCVWGLVSVLIPLFICYAYIWHLQQRLHHFEFVKSTDSDIWKFQ